MQSILKGQATEATKAKLLRHSFFSDLISGPDLAMGSFHLGCTNHPSIPSSVTALRPDHQAGTFTTPLVGALCSKYFPKGMVHVVLGAKNALLPAPIRSEDSSRLWHFVQKTWSSETSRPKIRNWVPLDPEDSDSPVCQSVTIAGEEYQVSPCMSSRKCAHQGVPSYIRLGIWL